jgi:glycerol 2-dehydrogenase (NADP+)/D-galacturonate reductase
MIRDWDHVEGWKLMETLVAGGKVKGIGVCNVSPSFPISIELRS